jgi:hypothetical protein
MNLGEDTQRTIILFLVILVFVFIMYYYWSVYPICDRCEKAREGFSVSNKMVVSQNYNIFSNTAIAHMNSNWFNRYTVNDGDHIYVKWKDLVWANAKGSDTLQKNKDFVLSFWLYLDEFSESYQALFRLFNGQQNRIPGVWLLSGARKGLHVRHSTTGAWNDGRGDEELQNPIVAKEPQFVTIVFSPSKYVYYRNGEYQSEYQWQGEPESIKSEISQSTYIQVADSIDRNFLMYNLALYEDAQSFTAPRVMDLYEQNLRKLERKFGSIDAAKNAAHEILQGMQTVENSEEAVISECTITQTDWINNKMKGDERWTQKQGESAQKCVVPYQYQSRIQNQ